MKNTKTKMQESKQMIASKNVSCNSNDFVGKDSTNLNQASGNNQSKINNKTILVKDKVEERKTTVGTNSFTTATKIVEYCKKYKLTPLSESTDNLSQKLCSYSTKLLIAVNQNLCLQKISKDLEFITTTFPDIIYGSGRVNDLNDHHKSANIPEAHAKFLALAITTIYERVFKSKAFKDYFKICPNKDKQEFIEINNQLHFDPLFKSTDLDSLSGISSKDDLDKAIDRLYQKTVDETLSLLESFFDNELSKDELQKQYNEKVNEKVMEFENDINTIKSELYQKTQELQNARKEIEEGIIEIKIEYDEKLEEIKKNYEITISKQKEENKILKKEIEVNKENYLKAKEKIEILNQKQKIFEDQAKIFEEKAKVFEDKSLNLQKLVDDYEKANAIGFKTTVNEDLTAKIKLADFDDESEEGDLSLSKTSDKKMDKDEDVDDFFSPEANKKELEIISTPNYTDNVNGALDNNDHVSCNGEDSFHSDTD